MGERHDVPLGTAIRHFERLGDEDQRRVTVQLLGGLVELGQDDCPGSWEEALLVDFLASQPELDGVDFEERTPFDNDPQTGDAVRGAHRAMLLFGAQMKGRA